MGVGRCNRGIDRTGDAAEEVDAGPRENRRGAEGQLTGRAKRAAGMFGPPAAGRAAVPRFLPGRGGEVGGRCSGGVRAASGSFLRTEPSCLSAPLLRSPFRSAPRSASIHPAAQAGMLHGRLVADPPMSGERSRRRRPSRGRIADLCSLTSQNWARYRNRLPRTHGFGRNGHRYRSHNRNPE